MRAHEFLKELFEKAYPFEVTAEYPELYTAEANINGRVFTFTAEADINEDEVIWEISFEDESGSYEITGKGDEYKVFSFVMGAIRNFISKYRPPYFVFGSVNDKEEKSSRTRLYKRMVNRFDLPGYIFLGGGNQGKGTSWFHFKRGTIKDVGALGITSMITNKIPVPQEYVDKAIIEQPEFTIRAFISSDHKMTPHEESLLWSKAKRFYASWAKSNGTSTIPNIVRYYEKFFSQGQRWPALEEVLKHVASFHFRPLPMVQHYLAHAGISTLTPEKNATVDAPATTNQIVNK